MEILSTNVSSTSTPPPSSKRSGIVSVLRRSSVVLNRRPSVSKDDSQMYYSSGPGGALGSPGSLGKRRFSTNPLTQSAPQVIPGGGFRRNSVAVVRRGSRQQELEPLSTSWGLPPKFYPPIAEEDDLSIKDADTLDTLSVCSDITDIQEDFDPRDWFLEEVCHYVTYIFCAFMHTYLHYKLKGYQSGVHIMLIHCRKRMTSPFSQY